MFAHNSESYPMVELDSDDDLQNCDSSEDEIDVILHGTPQQKRRLRRRSLGRKSSSSEDEFEKEMTSDLDKAMAAISQEHNMEYPSSVSQLNEKQIKEKKSYSDCYFDSDSDEEQTSEEKKKMDHPMLSNDDLFYDPAIDDDNQKWVDEKRKRYQPRRYPGGSAPNKLPTSDAILNCPACMTALCMDCQRHETFKNQYRAMFVTNCKVDFTQLLHYKPAENNTKKGKKRKKKTSMPELSTGEDEPYHPVHCEACNTQIAVYDSNEVFHFFNVLASH